MVIFDHVNRGSYDPNALMDAGRPFLPGPPLLSRIPHVLESAGWRVEEVHDCYVKWYSGLVSKIESKRSEILALAGAAGYGHVLSLYRGLLTAAIQKSLGAAFIRATPRALTA